MWTVNCCRQSAARLHIPPGPLPPPKLAVFAALLLRSATAYLPPRARAPAMPMRILRQRFKSLLR